MTYPNFRKQAFGFYKILSKDTYIQVYQPCEFFRGEVKIEKMMPQVNRLLNEGAHITENQFLDAYVKAMHDIHKEVWPEGEPILKPQTAY